MRDKAVLVLVAALFACDRGGVAPSHDRPVAPRAYAERLAGAGREREDIAARWRSARTPEERAIAIALGTAALERIVADEILPAWNGTPWAFSGTATAPGARPIACGYFVATALEHAGLKVDRRRLARLAAEHIITSLVPADRIARFRRMDLPAFVSRVARAGDGVYLVGLDYHVGFLVVEQGSVFFHHSSNRSGHVVREPALVSAALALSSYRIVGKLFDPALTEAWLAGAAVATQPPG